jgi:hypothetical protein
MPGFTLEIHCQDDGTYVCSNEPDDQEAQEGPESEGAPQDLQEDAQEGETFKDPGQVLQWVAEQLKGAQAAQSPQDAWKQEAASRDPQGYRQPAGGGGGPAMSM